MTSAADTKHPSADDLSKGLRISVIFHVALALFILFKSLIFPGNPIPFVPTLRVDIVGLPDVLKKDKIHIPKMNDSQLSEALKRAEAEAKTVKAPKIEPPTPVKVTGERAAPDEMVLKPKVGSPETGAKREKKLKSALDRIRALEKIHEEEATPLVKGNKVSKGTSLSADAKEAGEASYYDALRTHLQENWALPVWLARRSLSAQVQLFIDARGRLQNFKFIRNSGNPQFDEAVKKTLVDSQPYPLPTQEVAGSMLSSGILVGFPL